MQVRNAAELLEHMHVGDETSRVNNSVHVNLWQLATFVDKYGVHPPTGRKWGFKECGFDDKDVEAMSGLWLSEGIFKSLWELHGGVRTEEALPHRQ